MSKTIAIAGKGGVGKTTVAVNLALALHAQGDHTLLVDGSLSSPHVALHLGGEYTHTIHDVLAGRISAQKSLSYHPAGLRVIVGDPSVPLSADHEVLQSFAKGGDYVIYDTEKHWAGADQVLIVTSNDLPSLLEAKKIMQLAQAKNSIIAGVVLNKAHKHGASMEQMETFLEMPITAVLPQDEKIQEALLAQQPYLHRHPKQMGSKEIRKIAARLAGRPV